MFSRTRPLILSRSFSSSRHDFNKLFVYSDEIKSNLHSAPIIALESTIITHGMPYPENYQTASMVENIIRENGCIPATIGIISGKIHIGLNDIELRHLSVEQNNPKLIKASRRDLGFALANSLSAGTTVAATMYLAHAANIGIRIFATGGIGGVHRDAFTAFGSGKISLDISNDLIELSRTPIAVVCAGVKSILDIGHTLEFLETQGVPVLTFAEGRKNYEDEKIFFPSFFTDKSKYISPHVIHSALEAAKILKAQEDLKLQNGSMFAVPNPMPANEDMMNEAIIQAIAEAKAAEISGKAVTPYLLKRVNILTNGKSLESNIELIKRNAQVAAKIGLELHNLNVETLIPNRKANLYNVHVRDEQKIKRKVFAIGGANEDLTIVEDKQYRLDQSSNPARISSSFGGVARNIAMNFSRLNMQYAARNNIKSEASVYLVSAVGNDAAGRGIRAELEGNRIDTSFFKTFEGTNTGRYVEIVDSKGEMLKAYCDATILEEKLKSFDIRDAYLNDGDILFLDGNLSLDFYDDLFTKLDDKTKVKIIGETTSAAKAKRLLGSSISKSILKRFSLLSPNILEFQELCNVLGLKSLEVDTPPMEFLDLMNDRAELLLKNGRMGATVFNSGSKSLSILPSDFEDVRPIVNTRGCGDSLVSGYVFAREIMSCNARLSLQFANSCSGLTARTSHAVAENFQGAFDAIIL